MNTDEFINILKEDKIFSLLFLFNSKVKKINENYYILIQWNNKSWSKNLDKEKFNKDFKNYFSKIKSNYLLNLNKKIIFSLDLKINNTLDAKKEYLKIFNKVFDNLIIFYKENKKNIFEDFIISIFVPRGTYSKTLVVDVTKNEEIFEDTSFFKYAKEKYENLKKEFSELSKLIIEEIKISKRKQSYFQLKIKLIDVINNTNKFTESKFSLFNFLEKENEILKEIENFDNLIKIEKDEFKKKIIYKNRNYAIKKWGDRKLENICYGCNNKYDLSYRTFKKKNKDNWYLEVHHILPFSLNYENDNIYNLTKLCPVCHQALTSGEDNLKIEIITNFLNNSNHEVINFLEKKLNIYGNKNLSKKIIKFY